MGSPGNAIRVLDARPLPLASIDIVEGNPRLTFDKGELADLAASIQEHGVLQPIVVTPAGSEERFRLIAGERRVRASLLANKDTIPAVLVEGDEETLRSIQLAENMLRVQLNPLEEALAFARLRDTHNLSLSAIARRVKRSSDYVRVRLSLLALAESVRSAVADGHLSLGAAEALSKITPVQGQERLAQEVIERQLTVPQTVQLVREQRLAAQRETRRQALREKRDALVQHFRRQGLTVITPETYDLHRYRLSGLLTFSECGPCPRKAIFVSDGCRAQDCCIDPQCYQSLAEEKGNARRLDEQRRAVERQQAFQKVTASPEISALQLRYILWTMLRGLLSDTDRWRSQNELPPWHGGVDGTKEWTRIAEWPMARLAGGILELAVDYLVYRTNMFLPLALRQSLLEDFGVPADVLGFPLPLGPEQDQKEEVLP